MSTSASAWGADGHHAVADLAASRLTTQAAAEVARLLALEPGSTLASISTWPDDVRALTTAKWHYVNFEAGDCHYDEAKHCPGGQCVVGAIEKQANILSSAAADVERLKALKYMVHFLADIHQPLHAGYAHDRGGNSFQLRWHGHGTKLHALWDTWLTQAIKESHGDLAEQVAARAGRAPVPTAPSTWAEESCRIVQSEGFYPHSTKPGRLYLETYGEVVLTQIDLAAWRLAALLNEQLHPPVS
jgi:hypothetical protein